ncbi:hypothetical protein CL628_02215 [bacterium]|nr:hypothetical protein [bacterium]
MNNAAPIALAAIVAVAMMLLVGFIFGGIPLLAALPVIGVLAFVAYQSANVAIAARAPGIGGVTTGNINWLLIIGLVVGTFVLAGMVAALFGADDATASSGGGSSTASVPTVEQTPLTPTKKDQLVGHYSIDPLADVNGWWWLGNSFEIKVDRATPSRYQHLRVLDFCRAFDLRVTNGNFGRGFRYPLKLRYEPNGAWGSRVRAFTAATDAVAKAQTFRPSGDTAVLEVMQDHRQLPEADADREIFLKIDNVVEHQDRAVIRTERLLLPNEITYWGEIPRGMYKGRPLQVRGRVTFTTTEGVMQTDGTNNGRVVPREAFVNPAKAPVLWFSAIDPSEPTLDVALRAEPPIIIGRAAGIINGHDDAGAGPLLYIMIPPDWPPTYVAICWEIR